MNKAATKVFAEFVKAAFRENPNFQIIVPMLGEDVYISPIGYANAMDWFEVMGPALEEYIAGEQETNIGDKAFILAKDYGTYIDAGNYTSLSYLDARLAVVPKENIVVIDGAWYDEWLYLSTDRTLEVYSKIPQGDEGPLMSDQERHRLARECDELPAMFPVEIQPDKDIWRIPQTRIFEKLRRYASQKDGEIRWKRVEKYGMKVVNVPYKTGTYNELVTNLSVKLPRFVCREQARIGRETRRLMTIDRRGNDVFSEKEVRPTLVKGVLKDEWLFAARKWGIAGNVLREEGNLVVLEAPKQDFRLMEEVFEGQIADTPSPVEYYARNSSTDPELRLQYAEQSLVRKVEREVKRGISREKAIKRNLKPRFAQGEEPRIYLLGKKTGNLYPARFIRYVGHMKELLKPGSMKWREITKRSVLVEVLDEVPWMPVGADSIEVMEEGNTEYKVEYRVCKGALALTYEDELVTVEGERMRPAELHRFMIS